MWSKEAGDNRNIYFLIITYINLKRMMLSYVSGFQNLQKTKKHYFTLSKKKSDGIMKFTCLKTVFASLLKKLRSILLTHWGCSVLNSRRGYNEDTSSASLKYYMQDITVNNYHFISLKIIMLVFIT